MYVVGEVAEPGRDPVHDLAARDEGVDDVARLLHPLARMDVEGGPGTVASDQFDVRDGQVSAGEDDEIARAGGGGTRWYEVGIGHIVEHRLPFRPCSTS